MSAVVVLQSDILWHTQICWDMDSLSRQSLFCLVPLFLILQFYGMSEPAGLSRKKRRNKLLIAESWYLLSARVEGSHYTMFMRLRVLIGLLLNTERTHEKCDRRRYNLIRKFATVRRPDRASLLFCADKLAYFPLIWRTPLYLNLDYQQMAKGT